jgi:hypothetical protein
MDPVEAFLSSLRESFRPSDGSPWPLLALACGILLALTCAVLLYVRVQTRRRDAAEVRALAAERGLSAGDVELLTRLATRAGIPAALAMTSLAAFERVTARELARRPARTAIRPGDIWSLLGGLRARLGFSELPPHSQLHSTRELAPGLPIKAGASAGRVEEVTEAYLRASFRDRPDLAVGAIIELDLVRLEDARYKLHCRLLAAEGREPRSLVFAHDERPQRIQLRDFARVRVQGQVELKPDEPRGEGAADASGAAAVRGEMIDVSLGGMLVESQEPIPAEAALACSFSLEDATFRGLPARVVRCAAAVGGRHRIHLEQDRLSGAIASLGMRHAAAARAERQPGTRETAMPAAKAD